jgi:hypothetical protein
LKVLDVPSSVSGYEVVFLHLPYFVYVFVTEVLDGPSSTLASVLVSASKKMVFFY